MVVLASGIKRLLAKNVLNLALLFFRLFAAVSLFVGFILCLFNLQALMAQNDGMIDGPGHNTPEAWIMSSCFHLIFNCLQTLFAWFVFYAVSKVHYLEFLM